MKPKDELGRRGEERAAEHLAASGFRVVERNWRCTVGEIDIVAYDGPHLVVVEVKTRTTDAFGHPFEAISPAKLTRLHVLAAEWLAQHDGPRPWSWRVDVVGILWPHDGEPVIEHLREVG
jgi:putative endonuclease